MTVPKTRGICDREAHISMYDALLNWRCRIALRPLPLNGFCRFGLAVSLDAALRSRLVASSAHVGFVTPLACAWPGLPFLRGPRTRYLSKGPKDSSQSGLAVLGFLIGGWPSIRQTKIGCGDV